MIADAPQPATRRRPSGRTWRQNVGKLLAACAEDIALLEGDTAEELEASEQLARLLEERVGREAVDAALGASSPASSRSSSSSAPAPTEALGLDETAAEPAAAAEEQSALGHGAQAALLTTPRPATGSSAAGASSSPATPGGPAATTPPLPAPGTSTATAARSPRAAAAGGSAGAPAADAAAASALARRRRDDRSELLRALARENTVMESNLREYDSALRATMLEVMRLKGVGAEVESTYVQLQHLQDFIAREAYSIAWLREEKRRLAQKNQELQAVLHEALRAGAKRDAESETIVAELSAANSALRAALRHVDVTAALAQEAPHIQRTRSPGASAAAAVAAAPRTPPRLAGRQPLPQQLFRE